MKLTLIFFVSLVILTHKSAQSKFSKHHLGVSNVKLNSMVSKAIEGYRQVMLNGDEEMDIPVLDPNVIEDFSWNYEDVNGKHKILLGNTENIYLYGLSNYTLVNVSSSMKDLSAVIKLHFDFLRGEGDFLLEGSLFSSFLPMFGEGFANVNARDINAVITLNMSLIDSFINIDNVHVDFTIGSFEATAENLLDLPDDMANNILNDQLQYLYKTEFETFNSEVDHLFFDIAEETFGGMTLEEFFDFLDDLSSKAP